MISWIFCIALGCFLGWVWSNPQYKKNESPIAKKVDRVAFGGVWRVRK